MTKISDHVQLEVILCQLWINCFSTLNSPFIACAGKTVSFVSWCNTKLCQQRGLERHCSRKVFFWLSLALHVTSPTPGLYGSCGFQGSQLLQCTWPAAPSSQQLLVKYPLERFCKGIPPVRQYTVKYFAWQPKSHRGASPTKWISALRVGWVGWGLFLGLCTPPLGTVTSLYQRFLYSLEFCLSISSQSPIIPVLSCG